MEKKRDLYWVANYEDGKTLRQYQNGKEMKYADIDRERLTRFDMVDFDTNKPVFSMYLRGGQQLIYRRRTLVKFDGTRTIIWLVGWQTNVFTNSGLKHFTVINYLHEDGSVALDGARDNLELLDFET